MKRPKQNYLVLGSYLKEKRETASLSQEAVCKQLGFKTGEMVSKWERGLIRPPRTSIEKLIKLYRLNKEEFMSLLVDSGFVLKKKRSTRKYVYKTGHNKKFLTIGTYLKMKREHAGLSQGEVGTLIGHSTPQVVSDWERGIVGPPLYALHIIAQAYKLKSSELVDVMLDAEEADLRRLLSNS